MAANLGSAFAARLNPGERVESECRAQFLQQNNQPALEGLLAWTNQRLLFLSVERRKLNHIDHANIDNLLYNEGQLMIRVQVVMKNLTRQLHFRFKQPEQLREFVQCYQQSIGGGQPPSSSAPAAAASSSSSSESVAAAFSPGAGAQLVPPQPPEPPAKRPRLSTTTTPAPTVLSQAAQQLLQPPSLLHSSERSLQQELLQGMLVETDADEQDDAQQQRGMLEVRAALLARDPELASVYSSLVPAVLSDEEFWSQRKDLLDRETARVDKQATGRAKDVPVPQVDDSKKGVNKVRYVFNSSLIHDIFLEHPAVFHAYQETVGLGRMTEKQFWLQYLKSKYFHRQRKFGDLAPPPAPQQQQAPPLQLAGRGRGTSTGAEDAGSEIDIFTRAQLQALESEEVTAAGSGLRAEPGMEAFGGPASVYAKLRLQHPQVDLRYSESLSSASRQLGEPSTGVVDLLADSDPGRARVGNPQAVEAIVDALFSGRIPTSAAQQARLSGKTLSKIDQQKAREGLIQKFNRHAHLVLHLRDLRVGNLAQMEQQRLQQEAERQLLSKQRGSRRNKELQKQQLAMAKARAQGRTMIRPDTVEQELSPKPLDAEAEIEAEERYHADLVRQLTLEDLIRPQEPEYRRLQIQDNTSYFQTATEAEDQDLEPASSSSSSSAADADAPRVKAERSRLKMEDDAEPQEPQLSEAHQVHGQRVLDFGAALQDWRFGEGVLISAEELDAPESFRGGSRQGRPVLGGGVGSVLPMVSRMAAESHELPEDRLARFTAGKAEFIQDLRLRYARCFELFRHFWSCIPVTQSTLRKFQRLAEPLSQHYKELETVIHQLNTQGDNELTQLLHPLRDSFLAIFPKYDSFEKLKAHHERLKQQQNKRKQDTMTASPPPP